MRWDLPDANRIGLYLRAERAWGLDAVRGKSAAESPPQNGPTPPKPTPVATPGDLFAAAPDEPFDGPVLATSEKARRLDELNDSQVSVCRKCRLCQSRTHTVFGEGDPDARIVFVGEGPGETEDRTGRPFVGRAGELLDKMISAMGLERRQVYIANLVKCRPPGNRTPAPDESEACAAYLVEQLRIIRPRVIVTLGLPATRYFTGSTLAMGRLRGQWHLWRGIKVLPTYHPAYLLRNYTAETRAAVWSDLKKVMAELGLERGQRGV